MTASGIPADKIWLTDPSRVINAPFRNRITNTGVRYYVREGVNTGGRSKVYNTTFAPADSPFTTTSQASSTNQVKIRPAQVFIDADHIINILTHPVL